MEYKVPGESKFCVTTRPIHKLVLVVPVEEQTMEEPEDSEDDGEGETYRQGGQDGGDAEKERGREGLTSGDPPVEGPSLASLSSGETEVNVSKEERAREACEKEGDPKEQGKDVTEPAGSYSMSRGSLKVTYQYDVEEMKDMNQVPKRGKGRPQKANAAAAGDHLEASSPSPGKGSVPYKGKGVAWDLREMGSAQGKGAREGRAPQTGSEISSLAPARKEATWSRRKKERRTRRDDEDPACTE